MRRLALGLLAPLALSACVGPYGYPSGSRHGGYESRGDRWSDYDYVPLSGRITHDGGGYGVRLNRPAYVAVFEIVPGRGVGLLYPAYSRESHYLGTGYTFLNTRSSRYYDWYYANTPSRYSSLGEPRFLFLVASKRPLRISRFQRSPGALRTVLGLNAYSTINHQSVMRDLVDVIVPPQNDDDWTTDVLAIWPERGYDRYAYGREYTRVRCPDGTVSVVPWELSYYACPGSRYGGGRATPPPTRPDNPDGRDTLQIERPGRRRPFPAGNGGGETGETANGGTDRVGAPEGRPGDPGRTRPPRLRPEDDGQGGGNGGNWEPRVSAPPSGEPRAERPRPRDLERNEPRAESPRARDEPRREEPRRADPPARSEPRSEPRSESPRRADPPARIERSDPPARVERNDPPPRVERNDPPPRNDPPARSEPRSEPRSESPSRVRPPS